MGGDLKASGNSVERRTFFRVDDSVNLSYQILTREEMEEKIDREEFGAEGSFTVMSDISSINQNMAGIMHRIQGDEPDIAAYLRAINNKIDILGRALLSKDNELVEKDAQPVNLSASGMGFYTSEPVADGSILELRLILMPSFTGVLLFGEVVGCDSVNDNDGYNNFIRLNFVNMRESDRDLLIRHVIQRQGEFLKKRREEREAK
jgi:c-di-GMP-binding flagellar brake protein YcgR